ncbi:hypothetical protein P170DRAFT_441696 [Aspergillus steynii IBT 23096]|uniref:Uncharacterized protein n=1 Tax=Aspergillus steynii IBT 23096 TaxID=1392250 RepID=A0A2I2FRI4_9EURO|nr:uncharacterized protein P170DRAFT_441696 [Aspergillus steynii IBT 23096]PLB43242.1 hypothetical protein P170DRAFT_441696 [Aspergillus steynii IBT 23096]
MSVPTVRRAFGSISKQRSLYSVRDRLHFGILVHLFNIALALVLLPLNNTILLAAYTAGYLSFVLSRSDPIQRRQAALRDVQFYPKTILVTGVDTPHGLAVARSCYHQGHRVVGVSVTETAIPSGESMSKALGAFYRIPKTKYVSRLLDVINREKADVWVPCSEKASVLDDAMAKQVIEGRTECKCITMDTELASMFGRPATFRQYLVEKELPVVENHQVQSRDSIHKILHRSPTKTYRISRPDPVTRENKIITLPKRTLSLTYSEVSEIQISKESPWTLQQQSRLGEFLAEMLVVHGHVKAIKVRPADDQSTWGRSRLDEGLTMSIHKLMERFALKGGYRMTGHICVRVMVDEEVDANQVRYALHINGCTQGAGAVNDLLQDASEQLVRGYLSVEAPHLNGFMASDSVDALRIQAAQSIVSTTPRPKFSLYQKLKEHDDENLFTVLYPVAQHIDTLISGTERALMFWRDWRFSIHDPLPWWWDAHVYQPLKELESIVSGAEVKEA